MTSLHPPSPRGQQDRLLTGWAVREETGLFQLVCLRYYDMLVSWLNGRVYPLAPEIKENCRRFFSSNLPSSDHLLPKPSIHIHDFVARAAAASDVPARGDVVLMRKVPHVYTVLDNLNALAHKHGVQNTTHGVLLSKYAKKQGAVLDWKEAIKDALGLDVTYPEACANCKAVVCVLNRTRADLQLGCCNSPRKRRGSNHRAVVFGLLVLVRVNNKWFTPSGSQLRHGFDAYKRKYMPDVSDTLSVGSLSSTDDVHVFMPVSVDTPDIRPAASALPKAVINVTPSFCTVLSYTNVNTPTPSVISFPSVNTRTFPGAASPSDNQDLDEADAPQAKRVKYTSAFTAVSVPTEPEVKNI